MPALRPAPTRLLLAAFLTSTAMTAQADITPDALWQRWQDSIAAQGRSVTAERQETSGSTLNLYGVTVTQTLTDGGARGAAGPDCAERRWRCGFCPNRAGSGTACDGTGNRRNDR